MFSRPKASLFVPLCLKPETQLSWFGMSIPEQEIAAHIHPHGQDTWTVLSGMADYFQGNGIVRALREGEIAVARPGQVHGARNTGTEPFVLVSVVASANAGFVLAER